MIYLRNKAHLLKLIILSILINIMKLKKKSKNLFQLNKLKILIKYRVFFSYSLITAYALFIDCSVYLILIKYKNLSQSDAGFIGYFTGLIFSYLTLKKRIFKSKHFKHIELLLFLISGLIGLFLTYFILVCHQKIWPDKAFQGKFLAILISFFAVYNFRKKIVFKVK